MDDLIEYIKLIRKKLEVYHEKIYIRPIMEEISKIAIDNWVQTGVPNLTKEQFDKVILRVISKGTTLN